MAATATALAGTVGAGPDGIGRRIKISATAAGSVSLTRSALSDRGVKLNIVCSKEHRQLSTPPLTHNHTLTLTIKHRIPFHTSLESVNSQ